MALFSLNAAASAATGTELNIENATTINVAVYSAAGSTATVVIEQSMSLTAPFFTVATVTNPSTTGEVWSVPRSQRIRVRVSAWTSGSISGEVEAYALNSKLF